MGASPAAIVDLAITVTEREPIGVVKSGDRYTLVDRTGEQFRTVSARPEHLPLFSLPTGAAAKPTAAAVAIVADALSDRVRGRVESIQALDPQSITLLLTNGRVVRWGSADRSAQKARILPVLLHQPGSQFDVTDPDQPFSRP